MKIGVLSDTHGLLRPEVLATLAGADHLLHAGDVGDSSILDQLRTIAPVTAIRGNIDGHGPCAELPEAEVVELGGALFYMLHAVADLDLNPEAAGFAAVIFGHSHKPLVEWRRGVLFLNPGSCGPRRFKLPVTVAWIEVDPASKIPEQRLQAQIVPLVL